MIKDDYIIIDGHCDTVLDLVGESFTQKNDSVRDFSQEASWGHVDLPKLMKSKVTCQTMAMYVSDNKVPQARELTRKYSDKIDEAVAGQDELIHAFGADDIYRAKAEGKVALMKSIEGGEAMADPDSYSLDGIREFYERGVRMAGLTYNRINPFGRGLETPGDSGLTGYGKKAMEEMARLGMIVDVSHMSDESLANALSWTELPLVASHSNSRVIEPRSRNLRDDQMEAIAATGGVIGLMYPGVFVASIPAKVSFERLMEHLEHMLSVVGPDYIGLGSDFDGFTAPYGVCMESVLDIPNIPAYLKEKGWSLEDRAKIMGGNWLRVIEKVCS